MALKAKASQEFVPIEEIKNGVMVLKDGSLRAVLLATSLNFSLKSDDERQATLLQFQDFLNSLDFSLQIFIQSRQLDIRPYIALLEGQEANQTVELMRIQVREYIDFVKKFTESNNIMTKSFFIVVPYFPSFVSKEGGLSGLFKKNTKASIATTFEESKSQLDQRVSVVEQGLVRTGIRIARLGTDEIVELFYKVFNPGETEKPIRNI